jgi:hypothetical protein
MKKQLHYLCESLLNKEDVINFVKLILIIICCDIKYNFEMFRTLFLTLFLEYI